VRGGNEFRPLQFAVGGFLVSDGSASRRSWKLKLGEGFGGFAQRRPKAIVHVSTTTISSCLREVPVTITIFDSLKFCDVFGDVPMILIGTTTQGF
jgi:hypothetical protein